MRTRRIAVMLALATGIAATALHGQVAAPPVPTPSERLLAQGIQATRDLDYDSAATLLRLSLGHPTAARLSDIDRSRALAYLGATEVYRNHRDSAVVAFRRLIVFNPRYRFDNLVFPPEVTGVFDDVRRTTRYVVVAVPPTAVIASDTDRLPIRLIASSPHPIMAVIARDGGGIVRTLLSGMLTDSVNVDWNGRDSAGAAIPNGRYVLRVTSRDSVGQPLRTIVIPMDVRGAAQDTMPLPALPDSLLKPEYTSGSHGTRALLTGVLTGAAVVVLPSLVNAGSNGSGTRYVVAGAAGVAGVIGFSKQRRPQPIPANMAANQAVRASWQRQTDQLRAENNRRRGGRVTITMGQAQTLGAP